MVVNPPDFRIDLALDVDLDLEAVPVHLTTFVVVGKAGQGVGRLKTEIFDQSRAHRR